MDKEAKELKITLFSKLIGKKQLSSPVLTNNSDFFLNFGNFVRQKYAQDIHLYMALIFFQIEISMKSLLTFIRLFMCSNKTKSLSPTLNLVEHAFRNAKSN